MPQHDRGRRRLRGLLRRAVDAPGITIVARPAGRPGEKAALFSGKYGQSTGVVLFDRRVRALGARLPRRRVGAGGHLTYSYATHHRHTCIGARAGFGDLLIGAGALMCEANGFDPGSETHLRDAMVELIKIVEGFFACGVAAGLRERRIRAGNVHARPGVRQHRQAAARDQIYDMHRIAHYVSGGLIVALPGPDEDHNPETAAQLADVLAGIPDVPTTSGSRRRA